MYQVCQFHRCPGALYFGLVGTSGYQGEVQPGLTGGGKTTGCTGCRGWSRIFQFRTHVRLQLRSHGPESRTFLGSQGRWNWLILAAGREPSSPLGRLKGGAVWSDQEGSNRRCFNRRAEPENQGDKMVRNLMMVNLYSMSQ